MPNKEFTLGCGIDFGTTNSIVAIGTVSDESSRSRPLSEDGRPHASVVWLRLNEPAIVGREAKENINGFSDVAGNSFTSSIKLSKYL